MTSPPPSPQPRRPALSTGRGSSSSLRAFTMMEAMVTLVIASIVAAAAASAIGVVTRAVSSTRVTITSSSNLAASVQFMSRDIENAGGQGLPGAASIVVEDSCTARDGLPACNGTDRVTVFIAIPDMPVCAVRRGSRAGAVSFQYIQGGCCFPSEVVGDPVTGVVMLSRTDGAFRPAVATGIGGAVCEFELEDALPSTLYLNDPNPSTHATFASTDFSPFRNASATLVTMRTFWLDGASHELRVRNGAGTTLTEALVADEIYDLQVAIGVDVDNDGVVADAEWAFRGGPGPATDPFALRRLPPREVLVSVVQGVPSSLRPDTIESPLRAPSNRIITAPGVALRAGVARLSPANTLLGAP